MRVAMVMLVLAGCGVVGPGGGGQASRESELAERYGLTSDQVARAYEFAELVCDYYEVCLGFTGEDCVDSEAEGFAAAMYEPDQMAFDMVNLTCDDAAAEEQKCLDSYREAATGSCVVEDATSCVAAVWICE